MTPNGIDMEGRLDPQTLDPEMATVPMPPTGFKPPLPSPQNPTVAPPIEILLNPEEIAYFQEIRRISDQLNQQSLAINNQGSGALVLILKQHKLDVKLEWELSPDATKITRKVPTP